MCGFLSWILDIGFPSHPKENECHFGVSSLFVRFKQERNVSEMRADPCVGILAKISNPQVGKSVSRPFSNRKPKEKIAANDPNQHVSSFHLSGQTF